VEDIDKVKSQLGAAATLGGVQEAEEEEEEEDDADDEPPPDFEKDLTQSRARASVSAEAYGEWNAKKTFVPPVIMKTDDQKERLQSVLKKCFMFSNLDENDLKIIIGAMKEVQCEPKKRVINQGDDGAFLFVIESGTFDCLINKDGGEVVVKTCESGDFFGELALLYNCPRAASVESKEAAVVWQLDRDTFNHIVKDGAQKKRQRYDEFLSKVPILKSMDAYERSQLSDALISETLADGQTIMSQGEVGNKFYIIEEGEVLATKGGVQVMSYAAGDYFGELALLRNQPRAATCVCKGQCKLLSLDSASFKRLLNVSELLDRSAAYST
jgi:cAMP-dependent protein kinase regulator